MLLHIKDNTAQYAPASVLTTNWEEIATIARNLYRTLLYRIVSDHNLGQPEIS